MAQSKNAKARKQSNKKKNRNRAAALMVSVLLVLVIGGAVYATGRSVQTVQIPRNVTIIIDGEDVSRLSEEKAIKLLEEKYPWNMTVVYGEHTKEVENQIAPEIQWVVQQAFQEAESVSAEEKSLTFWQRLTGSGKEAEPVVLQYELAMPDGADVAEALAWQLTSEWGDPAENAKITEYDTASGRFLVEEGKNGTEIDEEKLKEEIVAAVEERDFVRTITAPDKFVEPAIKASAFKVMSTYETTTTANQDRNTNVRLAAEAVCGTILQPGEQFSYNTVVGPRTAEKGYKQAAAYSDGQTVLEYGGGVCQVSSTLYNAVIGAGLRTDVRTGHTFEPSYVTPGQDATVSYAEPDFVFTNTSDATVGIRAVYNDRKMYVEFYGVPVLEEGVKRYMRSEKTSELDSPAPTYVESASIPFGTEVVQKAGSKGSVWITNIVTEKDGVIIEEEYLHQTRYKGHNATILRNTQTPDGGEGTPEQPADGGAPAQPQPAPAPEPTPSPEPAPPAPEPTPEQPAVPETQTEQTQTEQTQEEQTPAE